MNEAVSARTETSALLIKRAQAGPLTPDILKAPFSHVGS